MIIIQEGRHRSGLIIIVQQLSEETTFIDSVMETSVIQQLNGFPRFKGYSIFFNSEDLILNKFENSGEVSEDVIVFKQFLVTIWFSFWAKYIPGDVTGSGWEYVNVFNGFENNVIVGFQSWIYLFNEEEDGTGL